MERIFKIKTKTNPDARDVYPSERRYSASIVFGLSVVFLQLFLYAILMGSLIIHKMAVARDLHIRESNITTNSTSNYLTTEYSVRRLENKLGKDLVDSGYTLHYYINVPALICAGCFIMALGSFLSFISGLFAWKRWYIDHNITFFFLFTSFSTLTSVICLLISLLTTVHMNSDSFECYGGCEEEFPLLSLSLSLNIIVLSCVTVIWSFLSTKVAYKGMRSSYPDDITVSKGTATVEVNTVRKGSKNGNTTPPDIIKNFEIGKLAKYLPKKENSDLPKAESNVEYQQRVNKFLSGEHENVENS